MKLRSLLLVVCAALGFVACDTETETLGSSLTNNMDHLEISTDTFCITTRSIMADSVFARNTISYLGTVRDPETGEYITANYMTQFHTLEDYDFPELDSLVSVDENGLALADSCELRLFFEDFYGDSLTSMKCSVYEMATPMTEANIYYSNFDPKAEKLIRGDEPMASKTYTLTDLNVPASKRESSDYTQFIRVILDKPYTDKEGNTYNNYGTYIMRKYYEDPSFFKNAIRLTNNVIPGFYIESTNGVGCMAYIDITQLNVYFRYTDNGKSNMGTASFAGTQEVMQRTNFANDKKTLKRLVEDNSCTYLKTPAGIFTEVTIPVDEICKGHDNDTINTASFTLQRLNNTVQSKYSYDIPSTVLLLPKDSLCSFFENKDIANYKTSYIATYSNTNNTYTFNNIGSLVKAMQQAKMKGETSEDWNKAVIVPVTTSKNQSNVITKIVHNMGLTNTRLVGGLENPNDPIKITVIYSKYQ